MSKICVFIVFLFIPLKISAIHDIKFDHLTTNDGLSQNVVNCIFQDSKGYIWFGTNYGLNKYDGYSFKIYKRDPKDSLSLAGNDVITIDEDNDGNLWIGTRRNGLSTFNRAKETFTTFTYDPDNPESISNNSIKTILFDSQHNLWIGTSGGLNLYQKKTGTFKRYIHAEEDETSLHDNDVHSLVEDAQGNLWLSSIGTGISRFDRENEKFEYIPNSLENPEYISRYFGKKLYCDSKGNIWIGREGDGIYLFNTKTLTFKQHGKRSGQSGLKNNTITSILEDETGKIWIGTDGGGINIYDPSTETFEYILYDPINIQGISTNAVYSLYKDRSGTVWVGTYSGGVDYYNKYKYKFDLYTYDRNKSNGLSDKLILSICEDRKNQIWLGIGGGGANIFDPVENSFTHYRHNPADPSSISSDDVICVYKDSDGDIWLGTYREGANLFIEETNSFRHFKNDPDDPFSLGYDNVWAVYEDSRGNLWFGLMGGGLDLFDKKSGKFTHFRNNPEDTTSISSNNLRIIFEDSKGNLWIGSEGEGLNLMNRENGTFRRFFSDPHNEGSISSDDIRIIYEDNIGNLWIGTGEGLNLFNDQNFTFSVYRDSDGLPDNAINGMLEDNSGNLWITTNKGLSRFNAATWLFTNYDIKDGLQGNEFNISSQCKASSGELYFGGTNGFNSINPAKITDNPYIPPIVLTAFQIYNKPVKFVPSKDGRKTIYQTIGVTKNIELTHKQNVFGFEFAALDFTNPQKNQYKYMLEGFDEDWIYTTANKRFASYTNLNGGEYIFKVIGSNSDNVWNNEGVAIKITILPPFWKTIWFNIIIVLIISFSAYSFIKIRYNNIKNQKIRLEELVEKQTSELRLNQQRLIEQSDQLNETNTMLEERQQQIEEQTEVLRSQSEDLISQAEYLETVNEHLETVNKTKDKLFSIIAHDLKSPFNTIFGFAELLQLKKDTLTEEKRNTYIANLYDSAKRVYMLLENLLQWSRSQTNRIKFEPRKFSIKEMIEDVGLLHEENLKSKELQLIINMESSVEIIADYEMIHGVVRNLLSNAIKYTPEKGTITINVKREKGSILFSVKDTGLGMPENIVNNLFHLDKTFSTVGTNGEKGTGLGLSLCKDFIEKHNGKIWAESEIGKGSNFIFTIPIVH
ncbi:MAG: hypothetical protein JXJ22_04050 [Bacteroidales bacterium]|nr:hypothetical protein [Bacteroidales bacterium]